MPERRWIWPLLIVSAFVFILSLRQLSDPDLGFHLKYGQWIVTNLQVPVTDESTYTVTQHTYTDLHWLFQVILYGIFSLAGYNGISILVCFVSLMLFLLLLLRQRTFGIPASIFTITTFITFLIIEPRIAPRPEIFTFLFLAGMLFVLDLYYHRRKKVLFILPFIMVAWCNMHALFVLGIFIIAVYFMSAWLRDRKPDKTLFLWMAVSFGVCFINPYGVHVFSLPLELLTRFDPKNIYNQHIQEFSPFFAQKHFVLRDYLFLIITGISSMMMILTRKKREIHEFILFLVFLFLAIGSIRNIPLFMLIAIGFGGQMTFELIGRGRKWQKGWGIAFFCMILLIPFAMVPRIITNDYYLSNNSFNKTGCGINMSHQPAMATEFLLCNHLDGRLLNSIGFGGWLSWSLPQPVFIDGRLEVMKEPIYLEVTQSWNGGLANMIAKYHPQMIVYNYLKYYPWTFQLKEMDNWRLIYADGIAAVFADSNYARDIPAIDLSNLPSPEILSSRIKSNDWISGFYCSVNYQSIDSMHLAMLHLQLKTGLPGKIKAEKSVRYFNSANLKYNHGDIYGALADYDTAILIHPGYAKPFNNRGILKASAFKDYPGAISDFTKAIELDPQYSDAFLGRGTARFLMGDRQGACRDWSTAHSLGKIQAVRLIELHCNQQ